MTKKLFCEAIPLVPRKALNLRCTVHWHSRAIINMGRKLRILFIERSIMKHKNNKKRRTLDSEFYATPHWSHTVVKNLGM